MKRLIFSFLFVLSCYQGLHDSDAVIVDTPSDTSADKSDLILHILSLVEQLSTRLTSWEDKLICLDAKFDGTTELVSSLETKLDNKINLHMAHLENIILKEFKAMVKQQTSSEDKIQDLEGKVAALDTNNQLHMSLLHDKIRDELDTTKQSIVYDVISRATLELSKTKEKIIEGVRGGLDDIRLAFINDRKEGLDQCENITKHVENTIDKASISLIYSGQNMTSNLYLSMLEIQDSLLNDQQDYLLSINNFTSQITTAVGEATTLLLDAAKSADLSVKDNERDLRQIADDVKNDILSSRDEIVDNLNHSLSFLEEILYDSLNNQSKAFNTLSSHYPTFFSLKAFLDKIWFQPSCRKDMKVFPDNLVYEKYAVVSNQSSIMDIPILCDTVTAGGGWIVLQRRVNWNVSFYRGWDDYKEGFGSIMGDFWLGLDNIYKLTSNANYELRIDMKYKGKSAYAQYSSFAVEDESEKYRLILGEYNGGTAGDSLSYHNGMKFSTLDNDNDTDNRNCASSLTGAWWYKNCSYSNLNGKQEVTDIHYGTKWFTFTDRYSVEYSEMKIRQKL